MSDQELLQEIGAMEFGIDSGDDDVGRKHNRWSPKEGVFRVSFFWWNGMDKGTIDPSALEAKSPKFVQVKTLFDDAIGTNFFAKGPEYLKLCPGKQVKEYIGSIIVVWPIQADGEIDMVAVKAGKAKVYVWRMPPDKYDQIKSQHRKFHLGASDVEVTVTDATYQKMTFQPYGKSFLKQLVAKYEEPGIKTVLQPLLDKAKSLIEVGVASELALNLSLDELRERMGKGSPATATAHATASSGEVDAELDGLIDPTSND